MASASSLFQQVAAACRAGGLDLAHAFPLAAYNDGAATGERLPDFGRPRALAILIGNTRALWDMLRARPEQLGVARPIDDWVENTLARATAALPVRCTVHLGHVAAPRYPPLQRIAARAGLAALSPGHLSVHPEYGPWLALRALVVLDADAPDDLQVTPRTAPCTGCSAPCLPAFAAARGERAEVTPSTVRASWRAWVAVRDACPVGRAHRYEEEQLAYHYAGLRPAWMRS